MKTLVIGGNRFFGKRLVKLLIDRGDQVTVLNRGSRDDEWGDQVARIRCDRTDARDLDRAVGNQNWDVVYDQVCYDADTAEAACRIFLGKVGRYIFTSTKSVYDFGSDLTESAFDPFQYQFEKRETYLSDYGEAKRQAETVFFKEKELPVTAVRFPIVFGPDDYTGRLSFHTDKISQHLPIYLPNLAAKTCFVHAGDAAATLLRLSELEFKGPINVCSPDPIALSTFIEWIENEVNAKAVIVTRPELGEVSPVGIPQSCYMNTDRLKGLGVQIPELKTWLPALIHDDANW